MASSSIPKVLCFSNGDIPPANAFQRSYIHNAEIQEYYSGVLRRYQCNSLSLREFSLVNRKFPFRSQRRRSQFHQSHPLPLSIPPVLPYQSTLRPPSLQTLEIIHSLALRSISRLSTSFPHHLIHRYRLNPSHSRFSAASFAANKIASILRIASENVNLPTSTTIPFDPSATMSRLSFPS